MKIILYILVAIITLLVIVSTFSKYIFNRAVDKEINLMLSEVDENQKIIITEDSLLKVPEIVQRWMKFSEVIGNEEIKCVRLKQKGEMRLKANESWLPAESKQYFTIKKPAFIWKVDVKMAPLFSISGRDRFVDGEGEMLIKLASLLSVVNAKGEEMNQGTMVRFLSEIIWFPSVALSDYIDWEQVDDTTARATFRYEGRQVVGDFSIDRQGKVTQFTAKRFREVSGSYSIETWTVKMGAYKEFQGYLIPCEGTVIWELDSGDFEWYRLTIEDIEYNKSNLYQ